MIKRNWINDLHFHAEIRLTFAAQKNGHTQMIMELQTTCEKSQTHVLKIWLKVFAEIRLYNICNYMQSCVCECARMCMRLGLYGVDACTSMYVCMCVCMYVCMCRCRFLMIFASCTHPYMGVVALSRASIEICCQNCVGVFFIDFISLRTCAFSCVTELAVVDSDWFLVSVYGISY